MYCKHWNIWCIYMVYTWWINGAYMVLMNMVYIWFWWRSMNRNVGLWFINIAVHTSLKTSVGSLGSNNIILENRFVAFWPYVVSSFSVWCHSGLLLNIWNLCMNIVILCKTVNMHIYKHCYNSARLHHNK